MHFKRRVFSSLQGFRNLIVILFILKKEEFYILKFILSLQIFLLKKYCNKVHHG